MEYLPIARGHPEVTALNEEIAYLKRKVLELDISRAMYVRECHLLTEVLSKEVAEAVHEKVWGAPPKKSSLLRRV